MHLYRHFNLSGELLYVGCTLDALSRLGAHKHESPWFNEIDFVTIQRFGSLVEALEAEKEAIRTELPKYNVRHRPGAKVSYREVRLPRVPFESPFCVYCKTPLDMERPTKRYCSAKCRVYSRRRRLAGV